MGEDTEARGISDQQRGLGPAERFGVSPDRSESTSSAAPVVAAAAKAVAKAAGYIGEAGPPLGAAAGSGAEEIIASAGGEAALGVLSALPEVVAAAFWGAVVLPTVAGAWNAGRRDNQKAGWAAAVTFLTFGLPASILRPPGRLPEGIDAFYQGVREGDAAVAAQPALTPENWFVQLLGKLIEGEQSIYTAELARRQLFRDIVKASWADNANWAVEPSK